MDPLMEIFGRVNNVEDSGWCVEIPINDDNTVDMDGMYVGVYVKKQEKSVLNKN